jgi:hypothetical protein
MAGATDPDRVERRKFPGSAPGTQAVAYLRHLISGLYVALVGRES